MAKLSKDSTEYLTSTLEAQQLHDVGFNRQALLLQSGVEIVTEKTVPEVRTTGNTACYLTGKCKIKTPAKDMPLLKFPARFLPHNVGEFVCVKEASGGAKTVEAVKMTSDGLEAVGTPVANDIYHFDGILYLSRYGG